MVTLPGVLVLQVALGVVLGMVVLGWLSRRGDQPEEPIRTLELPDEKPMETIARIQKARRARAQGPVEAAPTTSTPYRD